MVTVSRYNPDIIARYLNVGYWDDTTVYELWARNARRFPEREAVVDSKIRLTWEEARRWIDSMARGLVELGMEKGQVLVVQLPNCVELCLLRVACERAGVLCLPVSRTLRHREMEYILQRVEAAGLVIPDRFRGFDYLQMLGEIKPRLAKLSHIIIAGEKCPPGGVLLSKLITGNLDRPIPKRLFETRAFKPSEVSFINLTSGSTGSPKFVEYPAAARLANGKQVARLMNMTENDVVAILADAAGGPNIIAYFGAPWAGAKIVLKWFETEEVLRLIQDERVTICLVVPAILAMMVKHPDVRKYDLSSVRIWQSGGAPLPVDLSKLVEETMGGKVLNGYGGVDFGGLAQCWPEDSQDIRLLTVGRPFEGNEVRMVDDNGFDVPRGEVGEVWARGPVNPSGYFKDPEATTQAWRDGWFKMGDLGKFDDKGNLVIVGRKKDIIIRGGQNIFPAEIENLLMDHPKVAAVGLVGYPDQVMGERACACVSPKDNQVISLQEIVEYLKREGVAPYKMPERLEIFPSLPMLSAEKIDKRALRQMLQERSS